MDWKVDMKKTFTKLALILALIATVIGVFMLPQVTKPRMGGSPYASEQNALQDVGGWLDDSPDRTWTFVSANASGNTFVVAVNADVTNLFRVSMRVRAKQGGDYQYFILHHVAYDEGNTRTLVTLFGGSAGDLSNAAITDVAYSYQRFPVGFPIGEDNWSVSLLDTSYYPLSLPQKDVWYSVLSVNIPTGMWNVVFKTYTGIQSTGGQYSNAVVALSTSQSAISHNKLIAGFSSYASLSYSTLQAFGEVVLEQDTTFYLIFSTNQVDQYAIYVNGGQTVNTVVRAVSAYY